MNPSEINEIRERKKNQKCICKNCDECFHYRIWPSTDMAGNSTGLKQACTIEVLGVTLRSIIGSIDGVQSATNRSENVITRFGSACATAFKDIQDDMVKIRKSKVVELKKIKGGN